MGLLGLAIFNAQRRTKEIAVRKVLGASVSQIMNLLYRDFGKPLGLSFLIAFPISYYLMSQFLEAYPFRITISAFVFVVVSLVMAGVVILTVSTKSFQAAVRNPVDSLKE
jgi:putative ABC transport system permease protein